MSSRAVLRGSRAHWHLQPRVAPVWLEVAPFRLVRHFRDRRCSSTTAVGGAPNPAATETPPTPSQDPPRQRVTVKRIDKEPKEPSYELPSHILWDTSRASSFLLDDLPPDEIFQEALNHLLVCLHPQVQKNALYSTDSGAPVEPTLALYCPIEGANHIIDATVEELGRRASADVLVIDAVHLAGGSWGDFGAANSLQFSTNPLHHHTNISDGSSNEDDVNQFNGDEDELDGSHHSMTIHVSGIVPPRSNRPTLVPSSSRNSSAVQRKIFFESLLDLFPPPPGDHTSNPDHANAPRAKIVYIRDYPTLSETQPSSWFQSLLGVIRSRRQGPSNRFSGSVAHPMVIIFGMSGPLVGDTIVVSPSNRLGKSPNQSLSSLQTKNEWLEDNVSQNARERRLRDRLRKWERGFLHLFDEIPSSPISPGDEMGAAAKPQIVVVPAQGGSMGGMLSGLVAAQHRSNNEGHERNQYFRTSVILPRQRNPLREMSFRKARRREMNEIVMRMAVGSIGGSLSKFDSNTQERDANSDARQGMLNSWESRLDDWTLAKQVADRAMGMELSTQTQRAKDSTPIGWHLIYSAWMAQHSSLDLKRQWIEKTSIIQQPNAEIDATNHAVPIPVDITFERLSQDPTLTSHERRLLSCFVSPSLLTTTFSQIHLPSHTIDSIRSIVSLPLLHPDAFAQGILKEHNITGALLFGPPGTGKTLLARALAKESGARMMIIKPSDVMDMYVGEGEKLVRSVFSLARRLTPCVIFLDEIDALLGARVTARDHGGAFALRGVITEFMQEMDGLVSNANNGVVVIGATNRPFDLDDAILRRLPRRMLVDLPGASEREAILKIMLRDERLADNVNLYSLAQMTEGFSGSDLKHLCVAAALDCVKQNVHVPWLTRNPRETSELLDESDSATSPPVTQLRALSNENFTVALAEITPSALESQGSLADLRKWNEQYGEGVKDRHKRLWGGKFGFTDIVSNQK